MGLGIGKTYRGNKVPRLTKFLYPFSGIFRDACYALVGSFLLQYAINTGVLSSDPATFKSQYAVITVAMIIALVWDGINDPIMGFIVEKVHFKLGKFKPWILIGAVGNVVAVLAMFLIRPGHMEGATWVPNGWAFVGCMIAFYFIWDLFFTMNDIGYWAMLPSLTNDRDERAKLTSHVSICAAIGGFVMTAGGMLLPTLFSHVSGGQMFGYLAIAASVLFLLSQVAIFFFCREKERDLQQEEASEKSGILDLFRVIAKNPNVRSIVIAMFLYYLASGVLTGGIGLNYFYLSIGYGSGRGGLVATGISVMYVIAQVVSQAIFPIWSRKASKKKILTWAIVIQLVGYVGFLVCCLPFFNVPGTQDHTSLATMFSTNLPEMNSMDFGWAFSGLMFMNYLWPLIFFFGQGLMYMVILILFQDAIDYNEWKFGERKEAIISSWRPLDVKLSSAMLRLFQYLIFLAAGVNAAVTAISDAEAQHNIWAQTAQPGDVDQEFVTSINNATAGIERWQLIVFGALVVVVLVGCMVAAYFVIQGGYHISAEEHEQIVKELEERHAANPAPEAVPAEGPSEIPTPAEEVPPEEPPSEE